MGYMKNRSKKINRKNKIKKSKKKGGGNCIAEKPIQVEKVVNTGNCNIGKPDCFNPLPLPQLGILPTSPTLSEIAFDGRYCCGNNKDGIIDAKSILGKNININFYVSNGRFSTEGLDKKEAIKIKNILKKKNINAIITNYALGGSKLYFDNHKLHSKISKNKNFNQIGGNGYYLSLDSCPPGGLSTVKGYDSCCPPVFSGQLTGNTNNYIYNPFKNQYYVPALQQNIQVKGGGKKSRKKGGYSSLGFQTYPSYCDGKENWSQCGISSTVCNTGGNKKSKNKKSKKMRK